MTIRDVDHREIGDAHQLLGSDVRNQVSDLKARQRSGSRGSKLRHNEATRLAVRFNRITNVRGGFGHAES